MEATETILRGFWLAVATHLWQTTCLWAALFAAAPLLRAAPALHQELFWGSALAKLAIPLALFAPWTEPLSRFLIEGTLGGDRYRAGFVATIEVFADPLATARAGPAAGTPFGAWTIGTALWLAIAVCVFLHPIRPRRSGAESLPLDDTPDAVREAVEAALETTRIPRAAVRMTAVDRMPAVEGAWRPRIVLSERAALALDVHDLRAVVLHEDAHRRRRDPLRGLLERLVLAAFFYYPPLWFVLRRLRSAAEFRCDERAASEIGRPEAYASAIARTVALGLRPARGHAAGGSSRPSLLRERFTRIREPRRYVAMPRHRFVLAASLVALASLSLLAALPRVTDASSAPGASVRAEPASPILVGPDVTPPVLVEKLSPDYPEAAREARAQGKVVLQAVIDTAGNVESLEVLRGVPEAPSLAEAAKEAVRRWRYEPARLAGRPVSVYFTVVVSFALDGDDAPFEGLGAREAIVTFQADDSTLDAVLEFLAKQTGLRFAFLDDAPRGAPVSVDWQEVALRDALADLCARYPLALRVLDDRSLSVGWKE